MKEKSQFFSLLLLPVILLSLFLGGTMLYHGDFYYLIDQARDMLLTQDIVDNRNITLIGTHSGLGGFFHGPLWLYLLIPFYVLGGGDPFAFTYAYLLIAFLTILLAYITGSSLYNKKIGLLYAFIVAMSPSVWEYIPNTIGVNMVPLVFVMMFYFLVKYIRGDLYAYIFAVFFAGVSLQFETALPLLVIPTVLIAFFLQKKALKNIKLIVFSIISLIISLATFIIFDLRHEFLMTKSLLSIFGGGKHEKGYLEFPDRILSHLQSMYDVLTSILIQRTLILEVFLGLIVGMFVYLLIRKHLYKKKEWKETVYLICFPLIIFLLYLFYAYPVFPEYVLGLTVPVALVFVIIIKTIWQLQIGKILSLLFIIVTLLHAFMLLQKEYFTPYLSDQTSGSYLNQKAVSEWIREDSKGEVFGYFVYTPSTYTYPMDYLLWWETKRHAMPKPINEKRNISYIIYYPALENDQGAYAFWKKTKINTAAKPVKTKEFTGGIVVEKYSFDRNEGPVDPTYHQNLIFR